MTLLAAMVQELVATPAVNNLVDGYRQDNPYGFVEGEEETILVLRQSGQWAPPTVRKSHDFPRVSIEAWVDPTRSNKGLPTTADAANKARAVLAAVRDVFHVIDNGAGYLTWGTTTTQEVISSHALDSPTSVPVLDSDEMVVYRFHVGVTIP